MKREFYYIFKHTLKLFLLIACSIILIPFAVNAEEPIEEWVAKHGGTANSLDRPSDIAVDSSGNVYVTGIGSNSDSSHDYVTVAYDTNGNKLWEANYDGPGNHFDHANAIAIGPSGNIYVTGSSNNINSYYSNSYDYATVAYDPDGNELWVARYNGTGDSLNAAYDITTDSSGNIYVTGMSRGNGTANDYATVAYDPNGNQLWVARYNGFANYNDAASAIAIDSSDNVYVTGQSAGIGRIGDFATVAYDSNGNQLWVARYDNPDNKSDTANAIAVDDAGNVFVTGYSSHLNSDSPGGGISFQSTDYTTVAYDSNGNELWVASYTGAEERNDMAYDIALSPSGNVYVTGWSSIEDPDCTNCLGFSSDYATVAYDPDGNELWVARFDGGYRGDTANAITTDAAGNIYVTGYSFQDDTVSTPISLSGNITITVPGDGDVVPGDGGIIIGPGDGGIITGPSGSNDYATIAYDPDGNELWTVLYNGTEDSHDHAAAIATDPAGNVYVTGDSDQQDYVTIKYSALDFECSSDLDCFESQYCARPDGMCSDTGICTKIYKYAGCLLQGSPVCGCNGITYGSRCGAETASVSIDYEGYCDNDGDGYPLSIDCDDNNPDIYPGADEICDNADNNCDGFIDEFLDEDEDGLADCFDNCPTSFNASWKVTGNGSLSGGVVTVDVDSLDLENGLVNYSNPSIRMPNFESTSITEFSVTGNTATINGEGIVYKNNSSYEGTFTVTVFDGSPDQLYMIIFMEENGMNVGMILGTALIPEESFTLSFQQSDSDNDGIGDACDICPFDPENDADGDGICADADYCPDTIIPEENVPSRRLGVNRYALMDDDTEFDTRQRNKSKLKIPLLSFTLEDTAGCSCEQILDAVPGKQRGQIGHGCTRGLMKKWIHSLPTN